jgi:hypothetical protein
MLIRSTRMSGNSRRCAPKLFPYQTLPMEAKSQIQTGRPFARHSQIPGGMARSFQPGDRGRTTPMKIKTVTPHMMSFRGHWATARS